MIRINLMPRAEARRQAARQRDKQVAILIAVVLAVIVLATEFMTRRDANRTQRLADEYQAELAQLSQKHNAAIQLERKRKELESKLATIKLLERQRTGPVHVLDDLSSATPEQLWLTEMREAGGSMTILGRGLDNQTIALFMRNLAASRYFSNVDLVESKQVEEGQAKLKEFSIRTNVVYAGRALPAPADASKDAGDGDAPPGVNPAAQEAGPPDQGPPGTFAAPAAARQASQLSEARQASQDDAAKRALEEPQS
jgi:type IV pilus assembly protein PilN